ncbi:MAG: hypothetical protein K6G73_02130 [Marinilabiliaceae bacterium]|nr:hypothetical protein [Marinilabiliaceae bacterium]
MKLEKMIANIFRKLTRNKDTRDNVNMIWKLVLIVFGVFCYHMRPLFLYTSFEGQIDDVKRTHYEIYRKWRTIKHNYIVITYNYNNKVYLFADSHKVSDFRKGQYIKGRYYKFYFITPVVAYAELDGKIIEPYTLRQEIWGWINIVMVILCIIFKLLLVSYSYDAKRQDNKVVVRKPKDVIQDKYMRCYEDYNVYCNGDLCVIEVLFENGNSMYGKCYQIQEFSNRTDYKQIADDIRRNPEKYNDNKV